MVLTLGLLVSAAGGSGCIRGALATSTGRNGPSLWSEEKVQWAHVGEQVRFSFILISPTVNRALNPEGFADYCVIRIGEAMVGCELDFEGHFRCIYRFENEPAGSEIRVEATTYRQYELRDFLPLDAGWTESSPSGDQPDRKIASDKLTIKLYETRIELALSDDKQWDWQSGRLELHAPGKAPVTIYEEQELQPGYRVETLGGGKGFAIRYAPRADEMGTTGMTNYAFTIHDLGGEPHIIRGSVKTP